MVTFKVKMKDGRELTVNAQDRDQVYNGTIYAVDESEARHIFWIKDAEQGYPSCITLNIW